MALPVNHLYKKLPPVVDYEEVLWTPQQIATALWLDASDAGTITVTGSGVSQWYDKSGNGRHGIQSTDAIRPAQTTINSKGAIAFASGKSFSLASALQLNANQIAIAVYTRLSAGTHSIWLGNDAVGGYPFYWYSDNYIYLENGLTATSRSSATVSGTGTFLHCVARAGTSLALYNSGSAVSLTAATSAGGTQCTQIGARRIASSEFMNGAIGELIVVDVNDTITRQKLEGYLASKWAMTSGLAASHPYKSKPPVIEKPLNYFTAMNLEGDGSEYGINSLSIPR